MQALNLIEEHRVMGFAKTACQLVPAQLGLLVTEPSSACHVAGRTNVSDLDFLVGFCLPASLGLVCAWGRHFALPGGGPTTRAHELPGNRICKFVEFA